MAEIHPKAEKFLAERNRFGLLTTLRKDGSPCTVPIWYAWDGTTVSFFSGIGVAKLKRLKRDARITLTVASESDEEEMMWVSFEGRAVLREEGGRDLAVELAQRYLGESPENPDHQKMKANFEGATDQYMMKVEFVPDRGYAMLGDDRVRVLFGD